MVRVKLDLDPLREFTLCGAATPDDLCGEASEATGQHDQAAALVHRSGAKFTDQHPAQVGRCEIGESHNDNATGGVGQDGAVRVEIPQSCAH